MRAFGCFHFVSVLSASLKRRFQKSTNKPTVDKSVHLEQVVLEESGISNGFSGIVGESCQITINISGDLILHEYSSLVAGTLILDSKNLSLQKNSSLNTTALGGSPPPQTSGTPLGVDGAGGGHGGRGACCVKGEGKDQEDTWGGDVYAWSSLTNPWSYGSKGGTTTREKELGGGGGGRVDIIVRSIMDVNGSISADGGDGGLGGGGGSGGSIILLVTKLKGTGTISASGGRGWAGGGGGRVSIKSYSRQESLDILVHGGESRGCTENAGAAGTMFDAVTQSLVVSNNNLSTYTDTLLIDFPTNPLWSNVYVKSHAKAAVPLLWSRVQVRGQISLYEGTLSFGLLHYPFSEFELMAEELLMNVSTIKVYGALRMSVKMLLMLKSELHIDGGGDENVATSWLETSNLVVLKGRSIIRSNSNLGIHGQGLLNLSGPGDAIEAQRLTLSLFYNINVGPGSMLQAPLENASKGDLTPKLNCESPACPIELIHPPEDCNVNSSLAFTLQLCRVEDINVDGLVKGSVIHVNRARTVTVNSGGLITASGLGCRGGMGKGKVLFDGAGGGGGHGGKGGDGYFNGNISKGGEEYGDAYMPCELGSGSGNSTSEGTTAGGGIIVMGSMEHSLSSLEIFGSVRVDGESNQPVTGDLIGENVGGSGGGSGGSLLLFLDFLTLGNNSLVSSAGGLGGHVGGGGGGGGRIHFDWSNIATGDEYVPLANVKGTIRIRGGMGNNGGRPGQDGTITGTDCPEGLFGIFCEECPVGTYKIETGSNQSLCWPCPPEQLPRRATYTSVRGGVTQASCPFKCISDKYRMPNCYTPLEELIYTLGGPWLFGLLLSGLLVLLALVLSAARMKFVGTDEFSGPAPTPQESQIDHSFPFLESLNEVLETNRAEESHSHVHRMYFMGPNTFGEPWHLPHSPPEQIIDLVYEDAFNRFVDEINSLTAYQWWEGSVHSILSVLAYPFAWSWQQWRRKRKVQRLREFVRSEYDHACLRSCRSRALYEGLKVAATPDLIVAYVDFFLGGDEKRPDLPPRLKQRFPMCIIFGGDGSYMAPYFLHSDNLLTSLLGQSVPATVWYRFVAGLNAYLRTVRQGCLRITLLPVINWLGTHANPTLSLHGIQVDLAWFQATSSGYYQLGLIVIEANETLQHTILSDVGGTPAIEQIHNTQNNHQTVRWQENQQYTGWSHRRIRGGVGGGVINAITLQSMEDRKDIFFPLSLILRNTRPVGHQDLVGLIISILLLGDFSLVLLTLLQFYSISLPAFLVVLFVLPLALLSPFPAGINALFSHGPRRSAGLARVYALWNITSLSNVVVALICGFYHYKFHASSNGGLHNFHALNFNTEEAGWWLFPTALLLCKCVQAHLVDWHIANLEIQDRNLYSKEPAKFWES
ncbi:hypothetical protein SUGI_0980760 [Cryptomeria japonica]|nr:hypothetical protein SUGI_0980760 [Cryptomeria japonica]